VAERTVTSQLHQRVRKTIERYSLCPPAAMCSSQFQVDPIRSHCCSCCVTSPKTESSASPDSRTSITGSVRQPIATNGFVVTLRTVSRSGSPLKRKMSKGLRVDEICQSKTQPAGSDMTFWSRLPTPSAPTGLLVGHTQDDQAETLSLS
jgi:hypothetical protein